MDLVTFATRVCKVLGVETMIGMSSMINLFVKRSDCVVVTNAAGGLNQTYRVGDIVCLNDVCAMNATTIVQLTTVAFVHGWTSGCSPSTGTQHRGVWCSLPTAFRCIRP
jgi:purine nucleoside phosphorylase